MLELRRLLCFSLIGAFIGACGPTPVTTVNVDSGASKMERGENFSRTEDVPLPNSANLTAVHGFLGGSIKLFHAKGTHQCWSSEAIGYNCLVEDRNFTDCSQAFSVLKRHHCCHELYEDGVSNNFTLNFCTPFI